MTGHRLFGKQRHNEAVKAASGLSEPRDNLLEYCYSILHSSGFYDDPHDNVRTLSNMEIATIRYIDARLPTMERWPIFIKGTGKNALVGIEQTFDCVLTFSDGKQIRIIGTVDGLVYSEKYERHFLDENKTASRLGDGWRQSFEMNFQITGYLPCATTIYGVPVFDARIHGVKIKPTNNEDTQTFQVSRNADDIQHWARWVRWTVELYEQYKDDYENAPRFTHSCNRYFRPCSLISFCADTAEGRREQWDEMVEQSPSPSEQAVMEQF